MLKRTRSWLEWLIGTICLALVLVFLLWGTVQLFGEKVAILVVIFSIPAILIFGSKKKKGQDDE